ncbi:MAG: hypothetical protein EOM80_04700 [Erysipelotrichia bacterium]|nr:hypothetical protein [Erysipelotrichia bacterium]
MKTPKIKADILEVFASIQGEGLFVGTMQLFIRLGAHDCPPAEDSFLLKTLPGSRNIRCPSSMAAQQFFKKLDSTYPLDQFFAISFIGGNFLNHSEFLVELLPMFREKKFKIFAETSGTPSKEFVRLSEFVNEWCVELKSSHDAQIMKQNMKDLETILAVTSPANTYFRVAIDVNDNPVGLLKKLPTLPISNYTLILQPYAVFPAHISDWDTGTILEWINLFNPFFAQVRWIPQVHKLLRIL